MTRTLKAVLCLLLVLAFNAVSFAENPVQEAKAKVKNLAKNAKVVKLTDKAAEGAQEVDLFQAIADDQIEVGVIQGNMKGGKLFVKNKTDKPLTVRMPKAIGTRPVMGQDMGMGGGQNQLMGGNMGMGGMGMGGMGMGGMGMGGMMNVPAEEVQAVKFQSLCLEHGKPEPKASIPYEVCKIEECTQKPEVIAVVESLHNLNQRSAQLAAWHLNNGVSVEELASETVLHVNGVRTTNFSPEEVAQAVQIIRQARAYAAAHSAPAEESSSSESMNY